MKFLTVIFLSCATLLSFAQSGMVNPDNVIKSEEFAGNCQRSDLQKGEFSKYFYNQYADYLPQQEITDLIKNNIYCFSITIVLGIWCGDSKEQVPRFFKILDNLDYNTNFVEIICVDRNKSAKSDISNLKIERVPTFIFHKEGIEKGRITESPILTIEEDIYHIINQ